MNANAFQKRALHRFIIVCYFCLCKYEAHSRTAIYLNHHYMYETLQVSKTILLTKQNKRTSHRCIFIFIESDNYPTNFPLISPVHQYINTINVHNVFVYNAQYKSSNVCIACQQQMQSVFAVIIKCILFLLLIALWFPFKAQINYKSRK